MTTPFPRPRDGVPAVTHDDIEDSIERLAAGTGSFAIDTERATSFRYSSRAYLVQIRREGVGTVLIDPVGIEDRLAPLAFIMQDEWILHDAEQDLLALRELGLEPQSVFDTEMAGLLLGCEHISLQAMVSDLLGYELAKEHATSDWSQRPLPDSMLIYAALDVELLHDLRRVLLQMLMKAGRYEWFVEECEFIRTRPAPKPKPEPWRRIAHRLGIDDVRSLGMLRELWNTRDAIAKNLDVPPSQVFSSNVLGELSRRKPRSRADVARSPLMRSLDQRQFVDDFWQAIYRVWSMPTSSLPDRFLKHKNRPYPPVSRWENTHPDAAQRLLTVRGKVMELSEELGIRHDIILKPAYQKQLAWEGWQDAESAHNALLEFGARPWQAELVVNAITSR